MMSVEAEELTTAPSSKENTVDMNGLEDRSASIETEENVIDDISISVKT